MYKLLFKPTSKMTLMALSLVICLAPRTWGQEPMQHPEPTPHEEMQHIELSFPTSLIPGLPLINQALTMDEAVDLGLANNLDIDVAQAEVGIRQASLLEAKAKRWPTLSVGALSFLRSGNSQTLMTPETTMTTVDTALFQDLNATGKIPLFTGGGLKAGIRMARYSVGEADASVNQARVDAAYQIKTAYLKALLSHSTHLVHQAHLAVQDALLKNVTVRYTSGRGLKADVLRVQAEMANAQMMLNDEHVQLNSIFYDLKAAMGVDMGSDIALADPLVLRPWSGPTLAQLVQDTVGKHPKVREAQKQVQQASAEIQVVKSQYYPQVYGQVTGNLRFPERPDMMGNGVIGMVTASLPVLDKNRRVEVATAQARLLKAQQVLKVLQLDLSKQVAQAWNTLDFARENVALAQQTIVLAQEDLRLVQLRYDAGRAVLVEVQDAAWQLRNAQLSQATALYTYELAKAKLLQAIGLP